MQNTPFSQEYQKLAFETQAPYGYVQAPVTMAPAHSSLFAAPIKEKQPKPFKIVVLVALVIAMVYGISCCYELEATNAYHEQSISDLVQRVSTMETRFDRKQDQVSFVQEELAKSINFFNLAATAEISVTCNGTDLCQVISNVNATDHQLRREINMLTNNIDTLENEINLQQEQLDELQNRTGPNNTNPNVTSLHYLKSIQVPGSSLFTSNIVELADGRLAAGQYGNNYSTSAASVLIFNLTTGQLSANLTAPNIVGWYIQQIYQLFDERLLVSVYDVHQVGVSLLHVWNVTTNTLMQTINTTVNGAHSILQLHNFNITIIDVNGNLNVYDPSDLQNAQVVIPNVQSNFVDSFSCQVELFERYAPVLYAIYDYGHLAVINTSTWEFDGYVPINNFNGTTADSEVRAIYPGGPQHIAAYSDIHTNPIVIHIAPHMQNYVIHSHSLAIGTFGHGILATVAYDYNIISLWNPMNGEFLRFLSLGVPDSAAYLIGLHGAFNGLAVSSANTGDIAIYSF